MTGRETIARVTGKLVVLLLSIRTGFRRGALAPFPALPRFGTLTGTFPGKMAYGM